MGMDAPPDPRPDLRRDHARWTALLQLAWERDGGDPAGLFQALYALRQCGGAIVTRHQPLDLTPDGPPLHWRLLRGEMAEADWQRFRHERLLPHKAVLLELLRGSDIMKLQNGVVLSGKLRDLRVEQVTLERRAAAGRAGDAGHGSPGVRRASPGGFPGGPCGRGAGVCGAGRIRTRGHSRRLAAVQLAGWRHSSDGGRGRRPGDLPERDAGAARHGAADQAAGAAAGGEAAAADVAMKRTRSSGDGNQDTEPGRSYWRSRRGLTTITVTDLREDLRKYIELAHYKGKHFLVERNREEFVVILGVEDYRRLVAVAESKG